MGHVIYLLIVLAIWLFNTIAAAIRRAARPAAQVPRQSMSPIAPQAPTAPGYPAPRAGQYTAPTAPGQQAVPYQYAPSQGPPPAFGNPPGGMAYPPQPAMPYQYAPQQPQVYGGPPPGGMAYPPQQAMPYQYAPPQPSQVYGGPPPGMAAYPAQYAPPVQPAVQYPYPYANPAQMRQQAVPPIPATVREVKPAPAPAASARRAPAPNQEQPDVQSRLDAGTATERSAQTSTPLLESMLQGQRPLLASFIMHEVLAPPLCKRARLGLGNRV